VGHSGKDACAPLVAFMATPERVADAAGRRDREHPIRTISARDRSLMLHKAALIVGHLKRKEFSADSAAKMRALGEQARIRAKPYTECALEARQATGRAAEAAKPYVVRDKEAARKTCDDALRLAKEPIEKSRNEGRPEAGVAGAAARPQLFRANVLATALGGGLGL
jgi:hypothetical protein